MRALPLLAAGLLLAAPAAAHLVPPGQGQLRLDADGAFLIASLPVRALDGFDDDHDGLLSLDELAAHRASLLRQVDEAVVIAGDDGAGMVSFEDLLFPHADEGPTPAEHLAIMRRTRLAAPRGPVTVRAPYLARWPGEGLVLQVSDGGRTSVVRLDRDAPVARLREPPFPAAALLGASALAVALAALGARLLRRARLDAPRTGD